MRILVTGAGGFVGRHLLPRLGPDGHEIVRLHRGGPAPDGPHWSVPPDLASIADAPDFPGVDAVIHLAAANPAKGTAGAADAAALRRANVEGTQALARRCREAGVARFVFLSTANVHAPRADGRAITERDPIDPQNAYARSKAEAEAALAQELAGSATQLRILRPAPIFGVGGRGTVALLQRLAKTPLPLPLGGLGGRRSLISVEDAVAAIALAVESPMDETPGEPALLLSGGAATPAEIVAALRRGAGRGPRLLPAPAGLLSVLSRATGRRRAFEGLVGDFVIDPVAAERVLSFSPSLPLVERLARAGA